MAYIVAHIGIVVSEKHARPFVLGRRGGMTREVFGHILGKRDDIAFGRQPPKRLLDESISTYSGGGERLRRVDPVSRKVRLAERNRHRECRAPPDGALDLDIAAMQPDQLLDQGEADAGAFMRAAPLGLDAMEPLE